MDKKIEHPKGVKYPWFCFYLVDGNNSMTIEDATEFWDSTHEGYLIELEIDEKDILLSDYHKWHSVLNNCYFEDSSSEEEFFSKHKWFDSLTKEEQNRVKLESWEKVLDITKYDSDWARSGFEVQGTFWKLSKEDVKNITIIEAEEY